MYISSDVDQITMEEFFIPFGGKPLKTNRWVKLVSIMPWEHIEQIYMASFQSERGRPAISSRIAFGFIFIKENDNLTDEDTVAAIAENPYMQYFLGLTAFQAELLFDASVMVHFRKRFPVEEVAKINEYMRCLWVQPLVIQIKTDDLRGVGCCRNRKLRAATGGLQHTLAVDVRHQPGNCCFNSFHCSLRFIPKTHASGAFASNQKYPSDISSSNTLASRSNIMGLYGLAPTLRFF